MDPGLCDMLREHDALTASIRRYLSESIPVTSIAPTASAMSPPKTAIMMRQPFLVWYGCSGWLGLEGVPEAEPPGFGAAEGELVVSVRRSVGLDMMEYLLQGSHAHGAAAR